MSIERPSWVFEIVASMPNVIIPIHIDKGLMGDRGNAYHFAMKQARALAAQKIELRERGDDGH